ncbi:hypothetical protein ACLOJK_004558 [Asimina triloba]
MGCYTTADRTLDLGKMGPSSRSEMLELQIVDAEDEPDPKKMSPSRRCHWSYDGDATGLDLDCRGAASMIDNGEDRFVDDCRWGIVGSGKDVVVLLLLGDGEDGCCHGSAVRFAIDDRPNIAAWTNAKFLLIGAEFASHRTMEMENPALFTESNEETAGSELLLIGSNEDGRPAVVRCSLLGRWGCYWR